MPWDTRDVVRREVPGRHPSGPGPVPVGNPSALRFDRAEQAVVLAVRTRGEEKGVRGTGSVAVAELERPQPLDHHRVTVSTLQAALEVERTARLRLEGVDHAVAEVADQQVAAELAEVVGSPRDPPRRVERTCGSDPLEQLPRPAVHVDEPEAG